MKVLLVGNNPADQQHSMLRFCQIMERELRALGCDVRVIQPRPFFHTLLPGRTRAGKWLGYVDKYLLFPAQWHEAIAWADIVQICDHSNAVYVHFLKNKPHVVTCHDMLAVRGALGEDTDCPASPTGKILQRWILSGLQQANMVACISNATKSDVERLINEPDSKRVRAILLGADQEFAPVPIEEAEKILAPLFDISSPYILHVGSDEKRKNRDGVLRIFSELSKQWNGRMVFAGKRLTSDQEKLAQQLGVADKLRQLCEVDANILQALYSRAFALLFPSRFEGYGWPLVEAQACGCPVVCSDRPPFDEVVGDSALMNSVEDEAGFVQKLLQLTDRQQRETYITKGFENIKRFRLDLMAQEYIRLYEEVLQVRCETGTRS